MHTKDPSSLRLKSHPDAPGSKSKGAAAQTKTTTEPPATAEQPPPRPEGPRRPHLKPPPKLAKLDFTQCGDLSNAELLDRLALREFIVRYAALLYPPLLDIQRADQMRQRARRRSKLPTWLLDAADAPLNGFWRDPKATLSLLLAFLTVLENEMHDAKLSHGQPLLEGGKPRCAPLEMLMDARSCCVGRQLTAMFPTPPPSFLLFQAIVQGIDDLDLSQMEAHEVQKTSRYWLAAHHLLEDEGFRTKLPFRQSLATAEERQADSDAEEQSEAETEVDLEEGNENTKRLTLAAARPAADNSESDSEPSSSEDEKEEEEAEQGSEVSASLIDPHILQEDEAGSSSSSSSEAGDASGEEGPEEENDGSGRRSQRIRQLKHDEDAALKAQAHRALVASLRHRARRVTRATAGLSYDAADGEGHGDHEAQDIASRSASPKSQPRQQHNDDQKRRHPGRRLLNQFSPSRPITEAERVNVIQRFVELIVTRSEDFREAMQDVSPWTPCLLLPTYLRDRDETDGCKCFRARSDRGLPNSRSGKRTATLLQRQKNTRRRGRKRRASCRGGNGWVGCLRPSTKKGWRCTTQSRRWRWQGLSGSRCWPTPCTCPRLCLPERGHRHDQLSEPPHQQQRQQQMMMMMRMLYLLVMLLLVTLFPGRSWYTGRSRLPTGAGSRGRTRSDLGMRCWRCLAIEWASSIYPGRPRLALLLSF